MANSTLKCTGCKQRFPRETMQKHPCGNFCGFDCVLEYAKNRQNSLQKQKNRKDKQRYKAENKTLKTLVKEAQVPFNKYVRLRDFWEPCISCQKSRETVESEHGYKPGGAWDAGHFKTRAAKPQLRFNLWNVHKQCKKCNSKNVRLTAKGQTVDSNYEFNLVEKIGQEKVDYLKNNNDQSNFDREYLLRLKKIFNKKARILEKKLNNED